MAIVSDEMILKLNFYCHSLALNPIDCLVLYQL